VSYRFSSRSSNSPLEAIVSFPPCECADCRSFVSAPPRNPGGVRFGSAEIYDVLDTCFSGPASISNNHGIQRIADSLVVGQMTEDKQDERVVLFVKLDQGEKLTQETVDAIKQQIRVRRSARHVPCSVSHLNVFRYPTPPYQGPSKGAGGLNTVRCGVCRHRRHGIRPVPRRRGLFERIWLTSPYWFPSCCVSCFLTRGGADDTDSSPLPSPRSFFG